MKRSLLVISKSFKRVFSNVIKILNDTQTNHSDSNFEYVSHPTLKSTLYRNHLSILAIKENTKIVSVFTFNRITKEYVMKEIKDLDMSLKPHKKMAFSRK